MDADNSQNQVNVSSFNNNNSADDSGKNSKKSKKSSKNNFLQDQQGVNIPRPNISYAAMISQAIHSSGPEKKMTLAGIYNWISDNYPYYRMTSTGWQNSIRQ